MGENVPKINIGGIKFYQNDVKSSSYDYDKKLNTVFLQDGTKLTYANNTNPNANIMTGLDAATNNKKGVKLEDCDILNIKGTKNKDYYYLYNTDVQSVDIKGDNGNQDEIKFVYKSNLDLTPNTRNYKLDTDDKLEFLNLQKSKFVNRNEGFWFHKH